MPQFLMQIAYSSDSLAAQIKSPQDRIEIVGKQVAESFGAKILAGGYSFGEYDIALIVEVPSDTTMAAIAIAFGAGGAVKSTKTTALISGAQWIDAMKQAAKSTYRPVR